MTVTTNGTKPEAEMTDADKAVLEVAQRLARVAALRDKGWRVELSGGNHAILSDPNLLSERMARAIKVAMVRSAPDGRTIEPEATIDSGYVTVAAFLREWSFAFPLPAVGNFDSLLDLSARDFSTLSAAAQDLRSEAFTDFQPSSEPTSPFDVASG